MVKRSLRAELLGEPVAARRAALLAVRATASAPSATDEAHPTAVEITDEGWDFRVLRVGSWAVRVARRDEVVTAMDREVALLAELRPGLPVPLPRPQPLAPGVTVGPWLPGRPLGPDDVRPVATALAAVLVALHSWGPPEGVAVPHLPGERQRAQARTAVAAARARRLQIPEVAEVAAALDRDELWNYTPKFVHADLTTRHILVPVAGSAASTIAGIIDWTDARLDDPAIDVAGVGSELGSHHGDVLIAAYSAAAPVDASFRSRVRLREAWARVIETLGDEQPWSSGPEAAESVPSEKDAIAKPPHRPYMPSGIAATPRRPAPSGRTARPRLDPPG